MYRKKPWQELTLLDDYMFKLVFGNKEFSKPMLETILNIKIRDLVLVEREKAIQTEYTSRGIRLDIYAEDDEYTVYNVEMQVRNPRDKNIPESAYELAKRTRYYQALIDTTLLKANDRFWKLNQSFVIFICPFDPFDKNLPVYTFKSVCLEDKTLEMGNGATVIFLNTKGDAENLSPELRAFLDYVDHQAVSDNDFVQQLASEIQRLKQLKSEEEIYLRRSTLSEDDFWEAWKEGRTETTLENLRRLISKLHYSLEQALEFSDIPLSELDFYRSLLAESK